MFLLLAALPWFYPLFGAIYLTGVAAIGLLLLYEHWLVRPDDLSRVNRAFFHVNAVVSVGLLVLGLAELLIHRTVPVAHPTLDVRIVARAS